MLKRIGLPVFLVAAMVLTAVVPALAQSGAMPVPEAKPLLGIAFEDMNGEASITQVLTGSPADDAGLQVGDVIVAINDEAVSTDALADRVQSFAPGDTITITVRRDDETMDVEVTLGSRPSTTRERFVFSDQAFLGVTLQSADDGAVTIESVVEDGPAATAGLQEGDIITRLDGEAVESVEDILSAINTKSPGDTLTVEVERNGETQSFDVELGTRPGGRGLSLAIGGDQVEYNEDDSSWQIVELQDGGVLADAGLMVGDVITAIDGEALTPDQIPGSLQRMDPEATVTLTVKRGDETIELEAPAIVRFALMFGSGNMFFDRGGVPFEFTIPPMRGNPPLGLRFDRPVLLGVTFTNLNETTAAEHDIDVTEGALITEVLPESPAEKAGLMVDDVITAVDGDAVDEEHTLADRIIAYEPDDTITLDVLRDGETLQIDVTLAEVNMTPMQAPEPTAAPDV